MIYDLVRGKPYLSDYDREQLLGTIVVSNDFVRAKSYVTKQKGAIAIDVEWHDQDPYDDRRITEIGISYTDHEYFGDKTIHIIITDHIRLRQKYVPNRKHGFFHGRKWFFKLETAKSLLRGLLDEDYAIVGHGVAGDLKILDLGIDFSNYHIFDTLNFLRRHYDTKQLALNNAAAMWFDGIKAKEWHNAGNDAYWTMRIFERMAED